MTLTHIVRTDNPRHRGQCAVESAGALAVIVALREREGAPSPAVLAGAQP